MNDHGDLSWRDLALGMLCALPVSLVIWIVVVGLFSLTVL